MPLTSRMKWTVPSADADPWYDAFSALFGEVDAAVYAGREDRNIVLMGGGVITWALLTGTLVWTQPLRIFSPVSGFQCIVAAGNVQLDQDGKLLYAPLVRYPTGGNKTIVAGVASQVPVAVSPNDQLLFAVRYGNKIYWRNGLVMQDGDSVTDFRPEYGGGGGGSITLGGDLTDWIPTPGDDHQRVVGLNTVPIPEPELPVNNDLLWATAELLLSDSPFDITSDGTGVWVGDIQSPDSASYGGLVNVLFPDEIITTRHEYDSAGLGSGTNISIWSVCHLNGYVYATGLIGGSMPAVARLDPITGAFDLMNPAQAAPIAFMSYVRTDGAFLYLLAPHPSMNNPAFYWVNPIDLTVQTAIDPFPNQYSPDFTSFAHDPVLGKVWLVDNQGSNLVRVDCTTHVIDLEVPISLLPGAIAYGDGSIWVIEGAELYGYYASYTPGFPGYSYYPYTAESSLRRRSPVDGTIVGTVSDPDGLILGSLRMAYDETNGKLWVVCDVDDPSTGGSPSVSAGPRVVRVDVATMAVDGWCSLDTGFNMAVTVAGGFVWVVDSPAGDPDGGSGTTILKIDPALVTYPAIGDPAPGVIARITSGALGYQFIQKNQDILQMGSYSSSYVRSEAAVVMARVNSTVYLPTSPFDGERHTIVNYEQNADRFTGVAIYGWNGFYVTQLASINTAGGSFTFVWSATADRWVAI